MSGVRVAESSQGRPETQSRIYDASGNDGEEPGSSTAKKEPAVAEKVARRRRNVGSAEMEEPATRKGGERARCCSARWRRVHESDHGAEREDRAMRSGRQSRARRRDPRCRLGVRAARGRREPAESRSPTSTMTKGRRLTRRWWRGLCGRGEGFRWRRRRQKWFAERGDEEDGFLVLPFLCCDRSSLLLIVYRWSVADLSQTSLQISDKLVSVADLSQICHNLGGKFMAGEITTIS
ncbi:hypothetical protein Scep_022648 [Stephania cephalantha]|uniref:Uncharacterized protein n=1 Tax=Stephania cephalantha TaxID=152367 RepID=A0AAP0FIE7_9MAGN